MIKEKETKTLYFFDHHLKPQLQEKLTKGTLNPYNLTLYSLTQYARGLIRMWEGQGYKAVFVHDDAVVLLTYNK